MPRVVVGTARGSLWLLDGAGSALAVWNGILSGLLLVALALPRGAIRESYAGWNRYIV